MPDPAVAAGLIEKGGIIGLLILIVVYLLYELRRKVRELNRVYGQRDECRQIRTRYKTVLDAHNCDKYPQGIKVDVSDIQTEMREDKGKDE